MKYILEITDKVAPRVGAWIETVNRIGKTPKKQVAPRVGAWIETLSRPEDRLCSMSRPVWARGLKHGRNINFIDGSHVAPRVGAWLIVWYLEILYSRPNLLLTAV